MTRTKPAPLTRTLPELSPDSESLSPVTLDTILAGSPIEDSSAQGIDLQSRQLRALVVKGSLFQSVSFANAVMHSPRFRDVRLVKCDLSNAVLYGFEATRVEFIDCRLIGMKAIECRWRDVLVENCDGRYAQLNDAVIRTCEFKSSDMQEADFRGSDLEGTTFSRAALNRADFTGAKLRNADLRGAGIDGLQVRREDVEGAIVTPLQALELARLLGLVK